MSDEAEKFFDWCEKAGTKIHEPPKWKPPTEVLDETIEITDKNCIEGAGHANIAPLDGVFIATARFALRYEPSMIYKVRLKITPTEFLSELGRSTPDVIVQRGLTADEISDLCVNAFDQGLFLEGDCLWLYQHSDGRIIMQHST